jgi:hypothetical protein
MSALIFNCLNFTKTFSRKKTLDYRRARRGVAWLVGEKGAIHLIRLEAITAEILRIIFP